jgi:hypothetical protein
MEASITQLGLSNYLINKKGPAVSFFRHAYKNYSNFVKDTRELEFKNGFRFGQTSGFRFDEDGKYGDLVTNIILAVDLPDLTGYTNTNGFQFGYCNGIGNALVENVALRINGNLIDEQPAEFMDTYGQLTVKPGCKDNYFDDIQQYNVSAYSPTNFKGGRVYIPLQFWFCRNISARNSSLVLPLCSIYNSTIELTVDVRTLSEVLAVQDNVLTGAPNLEIIKGSLYIDYVILEEEERSLYIRAPRQMNVINQIQKYTYSIGAGTKEQTFSLKSMHYPVIELIFFVRRNDAENINDYFNYSTVLTSTNRKNPIQTVRLMYDGRDRIRTISANNFIKLETPKIHTNAPINKFIHTYSFALEPEKIEQPNGLCNFSEIQEALLHLSFVDNLQASTLYVFAVNYNVLICGNGNATLLHYLSKSVPTTLPDVECSETTMPNVKSQNP